MFCITSDPAASFGEARAQVTAQASRMIRLWSEQALLCSEAAGVIAARLMMIAAGDPRVGDESGRMVAEKVEALGEVWWHLADANWQAAWGTRAFPRAEQQATRVVRLYRRKVRSNLRRLSHGNRGRIRPVSGRP
jgi:hypothetical protein